VSKSLADFPLNIPVDGVFGIIFPNELLAPLANESSPCPNGSCCDENGVEEGWLGNPIPWIDGNGDVAILELPALS
jgi:hypothetical protein